MSDTDRDSLSHKEAATPLEEPSQPAPPPLTFPEGGARAWSVVAGQAAAMFCTFGYTNSFGVYQDYYQANQLSNKSPSDIAWIGSLQLFFIFMGSMIGGPLFDRFGGRVVGPSALAYVFSIMMTSLCKEFWQFILAQGLLGGIALGLTMGPANAASPQYFQKKRGAAVGLAVAGSSLGGIIFPIALGKMFEEPSLGFGWSVRIVGFIVLAILAYSSVSIRARLPPRKSNFLLPSAFKEVPYDLLILALFFLFIGMFTPIFFLPTFAISKGMSPGLAFYLVSILNAASFPGRIIPGFLSDRIGRLNTLVAAAISTGIVILCWPAVSSNAGIFVFTSIFGFTSGAIFSSGSVAFASIPKDPRNIGTYMGMGLGASSFAALIGPPVNGALVNHYGSYVQCAILSGVFCVAGGFVVMLVKLAGGKGLLTVG